LLHCSNDPALIANFYFSQEQLFFVSKKFLPPRVESLQLRLDHWSNGAIRMY